MIKLSSFFLTQVILSDSFFPTVIVQLMLRSPTCNLLVWTETASLWSIISCVPLLCCHISPWSALPSHMGCCQKAKLLLSRKMRSTVPRESPTISLGTVHVLFTVVDRWRKNCKSWCFFVFFLTVFSYITQNLTGDGKCLRQSSVLQSLACYFFQSLKTMKAEASPLKGHKFFVGCLVLA